MSARCCLFLSAVSGFLAVALGAFGAHGLKDSGFLERKYSDVNQKSVAGHAIPASYKYLIDFEAGVEHQMAHTLAMTFVGILMLRKKSRCLIAAAWCFFSGIVFFSGSLYVLVIGGPKWLGVPWGMITPIGGTLLLAGWLCLAAGVWRADYS